MLKYIIENTNIYANHKLSPVNTCIKNINIIDIGKSCSQFQ